MRQGRGARVTTTAHQQASRGPLPGIGGFLVLSATLQSTYWSRAPHFIRNRQTGGGPRCHERRSEMYETVAECDIPLYLVQPND